MTDRDYSRIPAINRRVHQEVLDVVSYVANDQGIVCNEEDGIAIDVSFMGLLEGL
jgi:hypothetical protein